MDRPGRDRPIGQGTMENSGSRECVLFFIRVPRLGKVKTRLASVLGEPFALELYRRFVVDILQTLDRGNWQVMVCHHPADGKAEIAKWLGDDYGYLSQTGNDLGDRMANGFVSAFAMGYKRVVLVGSDFPDLPVNRIRDAFERLNADDAVIGPALDGGYYLIGFCSHNFLPSVFEHMPWGTDQVFGKTVEVFKQNRCRIHTLLSWPDIDTYEDLAAFADRSPDAGTAIATRTFLRRTAWRGEDYCN